MFFYYYLVIRDLLLLEHDDFIFLEVLDADATAFFNDHGMLAAHKPANVGEEESSLSVMGICVSFAVLVVNAVVSHPLVHVVLWQRYVLLC